MRAAEASELFDRTATTYAPVNRIISLGLDRRWRRWVARKAVTARGARVLDAMTGTGEVAVEAAQLGARVTAVDVSARMLEQARERARTSGVAVRTLLADASLPLPVEERFDAVCCSFGLRYAEDPVALVRALSRALEPGGRLVLLEFCTPAPGPVATPAAVYFFRILPRVASRLAGDDRLYEVLGDTTRAIGTADDIVRIVANGGLTVVERRAFGFGLVVGLVATQAD